jgi:hypothetical protein
MEHFQAKHSSLPAPDYDALDAAVKASQPPSTLISKKSMR